MSAYLLTEYTPIEQLYHFYKEQPDKRGGAYTQEFLFGVFTVDEHDKYWVFEKLLDYGLITMCNGLTLNDQTSYIVTRAADRILRWKLENESQK